MMPHTLDADTTLADMSQREVARLRDEFWWTLADSGVAVCNSPPVPMSTATIAAIFRVTDRAVRKGVARAGCIRESISEHVRLSAESA